MAEIPCRICKETTIFGENCKCFIYENDDQQLLPRLDALDQRNAEVVANDEYPHTNNRLSWEINTFNSSDQATSKEWEFISKNDFPSFPIEKELLEIPLGAASQETYFENNDFSTIANFSINTNCSPVGRESHKNITDQSDVNLNFPEVTSASVHERINLVGKASASTMSMKDANSVLNSFNDTLDRSHTMKPTSKKRNECDKSKNKSFHRKSLPGKYKSDFANIIVSGNSQKVISRRDQLETQIRPNSLEKQVICKICERRFSSISIFTIHYRTHTNENPFVSDKCQKAFSQKNHLILHYRKHTNEKPFLCDICEKAFALKYSLVSHYRTHTGEKPYECDVCQKTFHLKSGLVVHHRTHTGEKPYECDMCEKRFAQKSNLNTHYRTHKGEKLCV